MPVESGQGPTPTGPEGASFFAGQESRAVEDLQRRKEIISQRHISTVTGLDLARVKKDPTSFIVDMYLIQPQEEVEPISSQEALVKIQSNLQEIDSVGLQNLPREFEFLRAVEMSLQAFLEEEEMSTRGERTDFFEYHEKVNSIKPFKISEEDIELSRAELIDEAKENALKFDEEDHASFSRALLQHRDETRLKSKQDVENFFNRFYERHRVRISEKLGIDLSAISFPIRWEERKAFWMMWERVTKEGYYLRANWHRKLRDDWTIGRTELYAIHEPAHFYFAHFLTNEINSGKIDPAVGVFTIPGPGCFQLEGIAQTMGDLAGLDITPEGRLAIKLYRLEKRALTNGIFDVENGSNIEEVAQNISRFIPLKSKEEIADDLVEATTKPFARAYVPIYGWSDLDFMEIRRQFGEEGTENIFLPQMMRTVLTRGQLIHPPISLQFLKRS